MSVVGIKEHVERETLREVVRILIDEQRESEHGSAVWSCIDTPLARLRIEFGTRPKTLSTALTRTTDFDDDSRRPRRRRATEQMQLATRTEA